jgi:hypothetical protein
MRLNARMRRLIPEAGSNARKLQPTLAGVADREITYTEDGIVFSGQHGRRHDFPDTTGYECFANHIHIDDYVLERSPEYLVEQALALATLLNERLCSMAPDSAFRFIIAANEDGCTLRFHSVRADELWETQDLEGYTEEAVAVIESNELHAIPQQVSSCT